MLVNYQRLSLVVFSASYFSFASLVVGSVSVVLGLQGSPVFVVQKWTDKEERHVTGNMSAMFVLRSCSCSRIDNLLGDDMDYAFIVVVVDNKFNHTNKSTVVSNHIYRPLSTAINPDNSLMSDNKA